MVQWATASTFSHAAMLFYTPQRDRGFENHFLIESDHCGVDLSALEQYVADPAVTIAVLRIPPDKAWLTRPFIRSMRGRMMETICDNYDYGTIERICGAVARSMVFGLQSAVRGAELTLDNLRRRPHRIPKSFICSGLVQVGYVQAFLEAVANGAAPPEAIRDVVFRNSLIDWFAPQWAHYTPAGRVALVNDLVAAFIDDLRATTPGDIEASENLEWCFLLRNERAYRIRSHAEAQRLMRRTEGI
jgi:hypothetical protein